MYSKQLAPLTLAACLAVAVAGLAVSPAQAATIHVDAAACPSPGRSSASLSQSRSRICAPPGLITHSWQPSTRRIKAPISHPVASLA